MCRVSDVLDPANDDINCPCRGAVETAYRGLLAVGEPENIALMAAKRVYKYYHPEDTREERDIIVERWVASSLH